MLLLIPSLYSHSSSLLPISLCFQSRPFQRTAETSSELLVPWQVNCVLNVRIQRSARGEEKDSFFTFVELPLATQALTTSGTQKHPFSRNGDNSYSFASASAAVQCSSASGTGRPVLRAQFAQFKLRQRYCLEGETGCLSYCFFCWFSR